MKTALATLLALLLAGCNLLPQAPDQPVTYHVLTDPDPVAQVARTRPGTLLLAEMDVAPFYQASNLAYSRQAGTRGQYQFAQWSEPPARRLTWLLRQRLEAAAVAAAVAPLGSAVTGDYQLNTRLIDFYHDAVTPPGAALLILEAELVRRDRAELLGRQVFVAQQPVTGFDAEGAADALSRAANQVMDALSVWLHATLPAEAPVK